jgi:hypothetical protein
MRVTDDMMDAKFICDFHSTVGTAVINNQYLNTVNTGKLHWQIRKSYGQCFFFVVTRYLNN